MARRSWARGLQAAWIVATVASTACFRAEPDPCETLAASYCAAAAVGTAANGACDTARRLLRASEEAAARAGRDGREACASVLARRTDGGVSR